MTATKIHESYPDGYLQVALDNGQISVGVIPELGGRVVSLRHLGSGREWMWRPADFHGYFANETGDPFESGPLAGWDECLPTIAPCEWQGRELPDHGEVWSAACELDPYELLQGAIATTLNLPLSPLCFSRRLWLAGDTLHARYRLDHRGESDESYVWAMHPLLAIEPGDRLKLTAAIRAQLPPEDWLDTLEFPKASAGCAKAFARVAGEVEIGVANPATGRNLSIRWDAADHPVFGLWLTRGGWHGHHHLALEPTNALDDSLRDATARGVSGRIEAGATREWEVKLRLF